MKHRNSPFYEVEKFENFRKMLDTAEERAGDKTAFMCRKGKEIKEVDYKSFNADTKALGTALAALGMDGVHVAMVGENSYEWITVYMTILAGRGVFVPVDKDLPFEEIINVLKESDTGVVFYSALFEEKMRGARQELPSVEYFVNVNKSMEENENGEFISLEGLLHHGAELCRVGDHSYTDVSCDMGKLKMLVYTSGTTGNAKGVMLSGKNLMASVRCGLELIKPMESTMSILPYHHAYESVCDILSSVYSMRTLCISGTHANLRADFKAYSPECVFVVPSIAENFYRRIWQEANFSGKTKMLQRLLKTNAALNKIGIDKSDEFFKGIKSRFGTEIKRIVCGGAPARPEVAEFFRSIGIEFICGYGITECAPLVSVCREKHGEPSFVGTLMSCLEIKLDGKNKDGEGEICLRGDNVMLGYYKNDIATESVFEAGGWFHTGDIGKLYYGRRLFITGRKKNVIVLQNGNNVYPEQIERYLEEIEIIEDAVVFANKNEAGNEVSLGAEVYLNEDVLAGVSKEERCVMVKREVDALNSKIPSFKNIQNVKIRTVPFDKTASYKIKRTQ